MLAVLSTLKCGKCGQDTTYNGSKVIGRGGTMRIDKVCADNQCTLQRRVKDRPKTDPLKVWWKQLPEDAEKEKQWCVRMKETRKKNQSAPVFTDKGCLVKVLHSPEHIPYVYNLYAI